MPSRLIPRLLVVFTRQLEILVTTLGNLERLKEPDIPWLWLWLTFKLSDSMADWLSGGLTDRPNDKLFGWLTDSQAH